uniref:EF-hand domain-containing protein n=1 Tax=Taeniopygia guttata TaxID=59729 RepID=A0A674HHD6_TAEGU
ISGSAVWGRRRAREARTELPFYDPSGPFRCLDGSGSVAFAWVNDDYCDCQDGSDEPGTPACPNGRFHCTNAGHRPRSVPAAHVNDGVCDCCDGTDEWGSGACENTCRERGRQEREERLRSAARAREGFALRQRLVQEAAEAKREKESRLGALQAARRELQARLGPLRAAKEAAEGPEREARERHRPREPTQDEAGAAEAFAELDGDGDGRLTLEELRAHPELDGAEIEAALGSGGWADSGTFRERLWGLVRERLRPQAPPEPPQPPPEPPQSPPEEEEEEEEPEEEEEEEEEDEEGPEQVPPVPPQEGEGPPQEEPKFDEATQALIDAAQRARDDLAAAERELKEAEDGIRALETELGMDFGPEGEFSYLYNQCWELSTSEYLYRLCPFQRVTQRPKNGGAETSLGLWGSWAGPEGDKFGAQKYEGGTGCWQGAAQGRRCGRRWSRVAASTCWSWRRPRRAGSCRRGTRSTTSSDPKPPEFTPKTAPKYPQNVPKISPKYPEIIPEINPKMSQIIPKNAAGSCRRGTRSTTSSDPKLPEFTPKIYPKYPQKYPQNIPKISQKYHKNNPENIPQMSQIIPKTLPGAAGGARGARRALTQNRLNLPQKQPQN